MGDVHAIELAVRPMTSADVPRVVDIHVAAFPGFFLTTLGRSFLQLFYGELVASGEPAFVAESAGALVGFVVGSRHPGTFYSGLLRRRWLEFALAALPALLRRPAILIRLAEAVRKPADAARPDDVSTLSSLGVDPGAQQVGAGRALVEAFLSDAERRGAAKVDLTTDKFANDRVNRFYSRLGFHVAREIVTPQGRVMNEYEIDVPVRLDRGHRPLAALTWPPAAPPAGPL